MIRGFGLGSGCGLRFEVLCFFFFSPLVVVVVSSGLWVVGLLFVG